MKKYAMSFLCTVLFFGMILSMTLYVGFGALTGLPAEGRKDFVFNELFFGDVPLQTLVRYTDYQIFDYAEDHEVMIGRENWLYETVDSATGFNYLLDYVGGCAYTDEQMQTIEHRLRTLTEEYERQGVTYVAVVIPSTYTACGEYLPSYLGTQSENTRLASLSRYLGQNGVTSFLDLSEELRVGDAYGACYHNTEDSVNAYGGFFVYRACMDFLNEREIGTEVPQLSMENIEFTTRYTEGKQIAKRLGLEQVISNRTVSFTDRLNEAYGVFDVTEHCESTRMTGEASGNRQNVVIEFSREWDKIQLMPYFSNTFETVVYENRLTDGREAVAYHDADVLIQILHESELDFLLS